MSFLILNEVQIRVGSPIIGWERIQGGEGYNLKRWVLSFERNVETDNELRVWGGQFQSLGAMTEN